MAEHWETNSDKYSVSQEPNPHKATKIDQLEQLEQTALASQSDDAINYLSWAQNAFLKVCVSMHI